MASGLGIILALCLVGVPIPSLKLRLSSRSAGFRAQPNLRSSEPPLLLLPLARIVLYAAGTISQVARIVFHSSCQNSLPCYLSSVDMRSRLREVINMRL